MKSGIQIGAQKSRTDPLGMMGKIQNCILCAVGRSACSRKFWFYGLMVCRTSLRSYPLVTLIF